MADEKITVRFSMDDTPDNDGDLLFEGPIKIYKSVNTVEDLASIDVSTLTEDIYVCVKNSADTDETQKYQRPSYYLYSVSDKTWTEVLIGTHSHENKELLDDLGKLDVSELESGKKILTVEKVTDDSENRKFKYKFKWRDLPRELPELPEEYLDKPVTLVYKDGEYKWSDTFVPAQTFQYKVKTITANNNESLTDEEKKTQLFDDVSYDTELGDQALLFINGSFITNYSINAYFRDGIDCNAVEINLNSDSEDYVFDIGDVVTLVIIKSGTAGFLNAAEEQFVTYDNLIKYLQSGISDDDGNITYKVDLSNYATKSELANKADANHNHSGYALIGHNHDLIYAPYYHVHNEYMTVEQVQEYIQTIILDNISTSGSINADVLNANLNSLTENYNDTINEIKTSINDIQDELNGLNMVEGQISADHVRLHDDTSEVLSEYVTNIKNTLDEIISSTNSVISKDIVSNINLGNIKSDEVISKNTTYEAIFRKLLVGIRPSLTIEAELSDPRPKKSNTLTIKLTYNPGSGCNLLDDSTQELDTNPIITITGLSGDIIQETVHFVDNVCNITKDNVKTSVNNVNITAKINYSEYTNASEGISFSAGVLTQTKEIELNSNGGASSLISKVIDVGSAGSITQQLICSDLAEGEVITKIIYKIDTTNIENPSPNIEVKINGLTTIATLTSDELLSDSSKVSIYEASIFELITEDSSTLIAENTGNVPATIYVQIQEIEIM